MITGSTFNWLGSWPDSLDKIEEKDSQTIVKYTRTVAKKDAPSILKKDTVYYGKVFNTTSSTSRKKIMFFNKNKLFKRNTKDPLSERGKNTSMRTNTRTAN